jgi:acyl carrier protein
MREPWHSLSYPGMSSGKGDRFIPVPLAEAHMDVASLWFSGHFPSEPILPGIAILSMVVEAFSRQGSEKGGRIAIKGIRKVRFRKPVRPDETLSIFVSSATADNSHSYPFKVDVKGQTVCTGVMELKTYFIGKENDEHMEKIDQETLILRIAEIIIFELKLEDITKETFDPDLDLVDELGVDSMDLATVVLVLQDEYGVTIDEDDYPKLGSIRKIADYIQIKMAQA